MVQPALFQTAQGIILAHSRRFTNAEMLTALWLILDSHGKTTVILIDEINNLPSSAAFRHRFGSLVTACAQIGYTPPFDHGFIEINPWMRPTHPGLVDSVAENLRGVGAEVVLRGYRWT